MSLNFNKGLNKNPEVIFRMEIKLCSRKPARRQLVCWYNLCSNLERSKLGCNISNSGKQISTTRVNVGKDLIIVKNSGVKESEANIVINLSTNIL